MLIILLALEQDAIHFLHHEAALDLRAKRVLLGVGSCTKLMRIRILVKPLPTGSSAGKFGSLCCSICRLVLIRDVEVCRHLLPLAILLGVGVKCIVAVGEQAILLVKEVWLLPERNLVLRCHLILRLLLYYYGGLHRIKALIATQFGLLTNYFLKASEMVCQA